MILNHSSNDQLKCEKWVELRSLGTQLHVAHLHGVHPIGIQT